MENPENMIEWITGQRTITVSFSDQTMIRKVKELHKKFPEKIKIKAENEDGTIYAQLPKSALKLSIIKRQLTEEQKEQAAERLRKALGKG